MGPPSQGPAPQCSLLLRISAYPPGPYSRGHPGPSPSCPAILLAYLVTGAFSGYSKDHFALETPAVTSGTPVTDARALSSRRSQVLGSVTVAIAVTSKEGEQTWDASLSCSEIAQPALS